MRRIILLLAALWSLSACASGAILLETTPSETILTQSRLRTAADAWPELIKASTSSIDIAQFYAINNYADLDHSKLEPVVREIEKAGARGVKIRFLVDQGMIKNDLKIIERLKAVPNLELRIYDIKNATGGILHAKYWLFDGKRAYVGSQNFDWRSLEHIHEMGMLFDDPAVLASLQSVFETDWKYAGKEKLPVVKAPAQTQGLELVVSAAIGQPAGIRSSIDALVELMDRSTERLSIQVMSYGVSEKGGNRWTQIDDALRRAAARGVRIRMMVADWMKPKPSYKDIQALAAVPNISMKVVTIPEHSSGPIPFARVIHSKYMIAEGAKSGAPQTLWIGTSNWSRDYFTASRNCELLAQAPQYRDLVQQALEVFDRIWNSPYAVSLAPAAGIHNPGE